jgi:hypothetical protein
MAAYRCPFAGRLAPHSDAGDRVPWAFVKWAGERVVTGNATHAQSRYRGMKSV